jgi:hypothetical protein
VNVSFPSSMAMVDLSGLMALLILVSSLRMISTAWDFMFGVMGESTKGAGNTIECMEEFVLNEFFKSF